LSGRGLCDGLITCPEESYRLWCVLLCDLGTSRRRRLKTRKWVVKASRIIIIIIIIILAFLNNLMSVCFLQVCDLGQRYAVLRVSGLNV
jgi:hypothetical protein